MSVSSSEMTAADYDQCLLLWPPAAVVIITAGKEEVRKRSMKNEPSGQGGQGRLVGLNKHRTFVQDAAIHVQPQKNSMTWANS